MMLELNEITKKYKHKTALHQVSLTLDKGIYGLLGPNGAGKSTLMNLITGNLLPDSGTIKWNGETIQSLGEAYRSLLGYAPQQQGMYDTFSGRRFLSYMATLKGIAKKDLAAETERVLACVNMTEAACRPIGTYSGGMKQRMLIAQAVLGNPKLLILDEPTAGLDPKERVRIRKCISDLAGEKVILVSTHVVSDIESIAREIILIQAGRILDHAAVGELCGKYQVSCLEEAYMKLFGEEESHGTVTSL